MDSDILLKDDGTAEVIGDRFKVAVVDLQMYYRGGHITTDQGSIELSSDMRTVKLAAGDFEFYYSGGHLLAKAGKVELGSTDSGAFKGFVQAQDGSVKITGDAATVWAKSLASVQGLEVQVDAKAAVKIAAPVVQMGAQVGDKFLGVSLLSSGMYCNVALISVLNPGVTKPDSQQRVALMHSGADELVLNAAGHYTGGVKVEHRVNFSGEVTAQGALKVAADGKLLLLRPDAFIVNPKTGRKIRKAVAPLDVLQEIAALQASVQALTARLAALEARSGILPALIAWLAWLRYPDITLSGYGWHAARSDPTRPR